MRIVRTGRLIIVDFSKRVNIPFRFSFSPLLTGACGSFGAVERSSSLASFERGLCLCRGLHTLSSRPVRIFGATHDVSDTGTSYIDGMTSSGPDIDELDVASDSGAAAWLSCSGSDSDSGCGAEGFGASALSSIFEATTQESPRVALSLGGGLSGMFMF